MNYNTEKNNKVYLFGEIVTEAKFSHEVYGEGFYEFFVKVMRLSGQPDVLPVSLGYNNEKRKNRKEKSI